jgi:hypothetical protein
VEELAKFISALPQPASLVFVTMLAVVVGIARLGVLKGRDLDPAKGVPAAQVAAVVVDPTALNALTAAVLKQTAVMEEMLETGKDLARTFDHMAIELDRVREELRIQREVRRI